jgi:hypothetical protein
MLERARRGKVSCRQVDAWLVAYLKDGLSPRRRQAVDEHLAGCDACRRALRDARALEAGLRLEAARDNPTLSPTASARIQERVYKRMRRSMTVQRFHRAAWVGIALIVLTLLAFGGHAWWQQRPVTLNEPTERVAPTPASSLIGSFIWQTDGQYGYQMLRPAGWDAVNLGMERGYNTPGFLDTADRVQLQAVNYEALEPGPNGIVVQKTLWEQNPDLDAWTAGVQHAWTSNGIEFTLLHTLPRARIYLVRSSGGSETQIVALAVDHSQPLGAGLTASGAYNNLERLQEEGLVDDLIAMVESMRAIPYDPTNVDPPLSP